MKDLKGINKKSEDEDVLDNVNGGTAKEGPADLTTILGTVSGNRKDNPGGNERFFENVAPLKKE